MVHQPEYQSLEGVGLCAVKPALSITLALLQLLAKLKQTGVCDAAAVGILRADNVYFKLEATRPQPAKKGFLI